jgi:hypothetical protein
MAVIVADGYNAPLYNGSDNKFFKSGISSAEYKSQLVERNDAKGSLEFAGCIPN